MFDVTVPIEKTELANKEDLTILKNRAGQFIFVLVFLLVVWAVAVPAAAESGKGTDTNKHFLWSVETGKNTVYLMGSIHVLKRESYPLPEQIEQIYGCCRKLVFETDMDAMSDPSTQEMIVNRGLYPEGEGLSKNIPAGTYELLKKRLALTGLSPVQVERFRPWFAAMTITSLEILRLGFDPQLGIDTYFFNRAKRDGKEMRFLETNNFQINLMAGLNSRQQKLFLRETLKELDVIERMSSDMVSSWKSGDAEGMDSILKLSLSKQPEILERFLISRNKKWVSIIERLIRGNENVLVIVGAGHLVGKNSVIYLLRKKGYKVRQL